MDVRGTPPSEEEMFYFSWGQEAYKDRLKLLGETLRQLLTLNATLLAGSLILLDSTKVPPDAVKVVSASFFLSLAASFIGIIPFRGRLDPSDPQEMKAFVEGMVSRRWQCVLAASIFFIIGLGVGLAAYLTA
jgi:hypothetical protein